MANERIMLQDPREWKEFLDIVKSENIRSYLEIGSKLGGTLWSVATNLPPGARVVAVDMPFPGKHEKDVRKCIDELKQRKYDAHAVIGDSTHPETVKRVKSLAPFDLVFIDGNHTDPFVRADWKNYGPLGRIVAFHDISWVERNPPIHKVPIHVPQFWNEIKGDYRHTEIRYCPCDYGIGVLWK
jgi:predicted O-methyltransferase YrrM